MFDKILDSCERRPREVAVPRWLGLYPALRPFIQEVVDSRIEEARPRGAMEIVEQLARPLPASVIARMLGVPGTEFPRFQAWGEDVVVLLGAPVGTAAIVMSTEEAAKQLVRRFPELRNHKVLSIPNGFDRRDFGFEWQMELPGGGDAVGWDVEVDIDLLLKREDADAEG